MKTFNQLKQNLKKDYTVFKTVKVAVLGDSSIQLLVQALRGDAYNYSLNLQVWEADFNQIENAVFNDTSELYGFNPDVIVIFHSSHKLLEKFNKLDPGTYNKFAQDHQDYVRSLYEHLNSKLTAKFIYYNFNEIEDGVFGSFSNRTSASFLFQLRKLNYELMLFSAEHANFYLCDLSTIQNQKGRSSFFQSSLYINAEMVLSLDVLPAVAGRTLDIIAAFNGAVKKCVILDLDNTVWGGIIGDDGIEHIQVGYLGLGKAFTEFQHWIKKLKNRGIIICVCSKNTESVAKEPFLHHPDMVLRLNDISVFVANWNNKVDNIYLIQQTLNIGFDSMVFLDDNPFERNMIRENIHGITVPELPEDPAEYLEYLYGLNLFETVSFSEEDQKRTDHYKADAERNLLKQRFDKEHQYLGSLEMTSLVEPFNRFNTPRVAQLSNRSNQFNLRTVRYNETDIASIANSALHYSFTFTLDDKFGSNGLICVIILKAEDEETLFIDSWLMSCRVLKRTMENFALNTLVALARQKGFLFLKGEYIPTAKNEMVKDFYKQLGFTNKDGFWYMAIAEYTDKETFIDHKPVNNI